MTMHMLPVYYTTNNNGKRKAKKKTKRQVAAEAEHQKFLEKMGVAKGPRERVPVSWDYLGVNDRDTPEAKKDEKKSSGSIPVGVAAKAKPKVYTGTEIIGIAQMHKSNAVPVRKKDNVVEIARMRR
jgi:hypothetical protein